jgi:ABC-type sugar transport system substrate-binding protein
MNHSTVVVQTPIRRHRIRAILYLLVGTLVIGCDRGSDDHSKRQLVERGLQVTLVGPLTPDPRWPGIAGGAQRFAVEVPTVAVRCVEPNSPTPEARLALIREALKSGVNALGVYVTERDQLHPADLETLIETVHREQTLLVTLGRFIDDPRVYGHVGADFAGGAQLLGDHLAEILQRLERESYLLLHADGQDAFSTSLYRNFISAARRQPRITMLQERSTTADNLTPAQRVEEMLDLFPHAGLLVMLDPRVWLNAQPDWDRQLRERNRGYRFATLSTVPPLWHTLGTPTAPGAAAALVGPVDGDIGRAAMKMVVDALLSEREKRPRRWIPCEIVTPETFRAFASRYAASANGLDVTPFLRGAVPLVTPDEAP